MRVFFFGELEIRNFYKNLLEPISKRRGAARGVPRERALEAWRGESEPLLEHKKTAYLPRGTPERRFEMGSNE